MDLYNKLKQKKVKVKEVPKWGPYLRREWEGNFVSHLSKDEKEAIYLFDDKDGACGYLWHVFSFEKRGSLEKRVADKVFNDVDKTSCFIFYQHSDQAYIIENAYSLTAIDLQSEEDIYVVDKDFSWTYVRTHESYLGPYFARKE